MKVGDICTSPPVTARKEETVVAAARRMRAEHVGDLIIVEGEEGAQIPVGILTDRDITIGVVAEAPESFAQLTVGDILLDVPPLVIHEDTDVLESISRLGRLAVRRLPVVNSDDQLIGIFTMDDAVAVLAEHLGALADLSFSQRAHERARRR